MFIFVAPINGKWCCAQNVLPVFNMVYFPRDKVILDCFICFLSGDPLSISMIWANVVCPLREAFAVWDPPFTLNRLSITELDASVYLCAHTDTQVALPLRGWQKWLPWTASAPNTAYYLQHLLPEVFCIFKFPQCSWASCNILSIHLLHWQNWDSFENINEIMVKVKGVGLFSLTLY